MDLLEVTGRVINYKLYRFSLFYSSVNRFINREGNKIERIELERTFWKEPSRTRTAEKIMKVPPN